MHQAPAADVFHTTDQGIERVSFHKNHTPVGQSIKVHINYSIFATKWDSQPEKSKPKGRDENGTTAWQTAKQVLVNLWPVRIGGGLHVFAVLHCRRRILFVCRRF
jgi:hypothetical protein